MRIPDLEGMIADYEDPLCIHCGMTIEEHELVPVYRQGRLALHNFRCQVPSNRPSATLGGPISRTYYFE